jgi:hypothetical protein
LPVLIWTIFLVLVECVFFSKWHTFICLGILMYAKWYSHFWLCNLPCSLLKMFISSVMAFFFQLWKVLRTSKQMNVICNRDHSHRFVITESWRCFPAVITVSTQLHVCHLNVWVLVIPRQWYSAVLNSPILQRQ